MSSSCGPQSALLFPDWAKTDLSGVSFSTYRMGGPLAEVYQPETKADVITLLNAVSEKQRAQHDDCPLTVIGWGGNVIIAERGISGVTLVTRKMTWVHTDHVSKGRFTCGAGVHAAKIAKLALDHHLTGAEFMIGIPGTAGGMAKMNAGALGQETADVLVSAEIYDLQTGAARLYSREELSYAYRHSMIEPQRHIVLEVTFQLEPGEPSAIKEKMDGSVHFRKTHHPLEPNGGSVFRNPKPTDLVPKPLTVGRMLDELGAKKWTQGGVRISERHANFIINLGEGTSLDVLRLMTRMKETILSEYGVWVKPENYLVGDATLEEMELWNALNKMPDVHVSDVHVPDAHATSASVNNH